MLLCIFQKTFYLLRGGEILEELLKQIGNLGFPIVISVYLLVRIEGKLEGLTESINELSKAITLIGK